MREKQEKRRRPGGEFAHCREARREGRTRTNFCAPVQVSDRNGYAVHLSRLRLFLPFPPSKSKQSFEFARYPEESRPTSRPLLFGGVHREPFGGVRPEPDEEETMGKLYTIRAFVFYTCPVRTISCACLLDRERRPRRYRFVALSSKGALEKVLIRLYG